jgi:hypothetical protein
MAMILVLIVSYLFFYYGFREATEVRKTMEKHHQ